MLKISQEVFGVLKGQAAQKHRNEIMMLLRQHLPEFRVVEDALLDQKVSELVVRARSFQIRTRPGIFSYVLTAAYLGSDFPDRFLPTREILEAHEDEEIRMTRLAQFVSGVFAAMAL